MSTFTRTKTGTTLDYSVIVDCVPTYGTCPEECGTRPCTKTQKFGFWSALGLAVLAGLYRYKAVLVPVQSRELANPSLGLHFRRSCTGTRMAFVRYSVDGCTGKAIGPVPVQCRRTAHPSLGFEFS
uniref:Uncharacterized protein n=1 Tax=Ananas comosus var. bracteatus TaxID=296719 RepID=A0A6V7P590_ANACO|nr:unnamed protein product [Ananas comosus var. bracteatus]